MTDTIATILGISFVTVICLCFIWTVLDYVLQSYTRTRKQNKKLLDNMKKFGNK